MYCHVDVCFSKTGCTMGSMLSVLFCMNVLIVISRDLENTKTQSGFVPFGIYSIAAAS